MPSGAGAYIIDNRSRRTPAYERVTSLPSWMPRQSANEAELMEQYRNTNQMFDSSSYDQASEAQQSRVLTTALNAGNNAASEYANRARQSGGSALGAGLVKAEAGVGARMAAGEMELERQRFDARQREAAATHATQIATTLGQLRDSYLKSLVSYATSEDSTMADFTARMAALEFGSDRDNATRNPFGNYSVGTGLGRNSTSFNFGSDQALRQYMRDNEGHMTPYGYVPNASYGG